MTQTRKFRNCQVTDNDIISAGFSIAGLSGLGSSYVMLLEDDNNRKELTIHIWPDTPYFKYTLYISKWPEDPKNVAIGTISTDEDLSVLMEMAQEILENA